MQLIVSKYLRPISASVVNPLSCLSAPSIFLFTARPHYWTFYKTQGTDHVYEIFYFRERHFPSFQKCIERVF
jgi:hypothetical protein